MANIPKGYAKRAYRYDECGPVEWRINPDYPEEHCFTTLICHKCLEYFEADREHICRKQNSYPVGAYWEKEEEDE